MESELRELRQLLTSIDQRLRVLEKAPALQPRAVEAKPSPVKPASSFQQIAIPKYVEPKSRLGTPFALISFACFFLAAAYIIRIVWESGWFTPERQLLLAAGLGISLILLGLKQKSSEAEYASGLVGTGIVILQMAIFGGHLYYEVIDLPVAVASSVIVSLVSLHFYTVFTSLYYIVLSVLSTYAIPFVLHKSGFDLPSVGSYHLVWALLFNYLAVKVQSRELHGFASFCGLIVFAIIALQSHTISYLFLKEDAFDAKSAVLLTFVLFQSLQFIVFSCGAVYHTAVSGKAMTQEESHYYLLPLLIFYSTEYSALRQLVPDLAPWISMAFATLLLVLYQTAKNYVSSNKLASLGIVQIFSAVVFFHSIYLEACPDEFKPWLFLGVLGLASVPTLKPRVAQLFTRIPIIILFLLMFGLEFLRLLRHNLSGAPFGPLTVASFILAIAMLIIYSGGKKGGPQIVEMLPIFTHIQALTAFYHLLRDVGTLAVTVSWGVYAVAILALAFKTFDRNLGKTSVLVLGAAAAKALFYDIGFKGGTSTIGVLITTGIVLYAGAQLLNKVDQIPKAKN